MSSTLPSYLRVQRRRAALTLKELGLLLGNRDWSTCGKYERLERTPPSHVLIGCELLFGADAQAIFPALYATVRRDLLREAATLLAQLKDDQSSRMRVKREWIEAIISRLNT